jgi:hypothetical protein
MLGMGCALYIRCAFSIYEKECRKSFGCALYISVRYLQENTVILGGFEVATAWILVFLGDGAKFVCEIGIY